MPARLIKISELQPTDLLRESSQLYLQTLSVNQIERMHGIPQVWETPEGLLISDGNQRTANYAKRKINQIKVDYQKTDIPDYFLDCLNLIISRAELLKRQGIYSPQDLWRA